MARKKIVLKSKETRRRYMDEFKAEAVQFNCRKADKNVDLHQNFSLGRIYEDGTVRHEELEVDYEAIAAALADTSSDLVVKSKRSRKTKRSSDCPE